MTGPRIVRRAADLFKESRAARSAALALLLAAVFVTSLRIIKDPGPATFAPQSRSDFEDYYQASRMVDRGEDPYRVEQLQGIMELPKSFRPEDLMNPARLAELLSMFKGLGTYLYLPFTAFVLLPISKLDYKTAAAIFQILSFSAWIGVLYFLYRIARVGRPLLTEKEFMLPLLAAYALLGGFLSENASNGNIAFFLLLLVAPGLYLSFSDRWWAQILGGILIGIAAVLKVTPIFLVLVLFGSLRIYAIGGAVLGVVFGIAVPALGLGMDRNLALLQGWYNLILETYSKYVFLRPWANNQTISGAIGKWFLPGSDLKQGDYGLPLIGGLPNKELYHSLGLYVKLMNAALLGLAGIASLAAAYGSFRDHFRGMIREVLGSKDSRPLFLEDERTARLLWLVTLVSLVTAGVSWYHAYSVLFLPVFIRFFQVFSGGRFERGETACLFFTGFFSLAPMILGARIRDGLALYSVFTVGVVAMIVYLALLVIRSDRRSANGI